MMLFPLFILDFCVSYLSMNTWCSKNMGSLAEPCTEDIEPFMKTCKALCMVLWPDTAMPVAGSANPVGGKKRRDKRDRNKRCL